MSQEKFRMNLLEVVRKNASFQRDKKKSSSGFSGNEKMGDEKKALCFNLPNAHCALL